MDRCAAVYTPAVLVFLVPVVGLGLAAAEWFYQALMLLVIACPCALVIATPVGVVVALAGHTEQELLERAVALESHSDHPMPRAIVAYGLARSIEALPAEAFTILSGKGATGIWQGKPFWLGSHRYLEELGKETPEIHERLEGLGRIK